MLLKNVCVLNIFNELKGKDHISIILTCSDTNPRFLLKSLVFSCYMHLKSLINRNKDYISVVRKYRSFSSIKIAIKNGKFWSSFFFNFNLFFSPSNCHCNIALARDFPTIPNLSSSCEYSKSYNGLKNWCNE